MKRRKHDTLITIFYLFIAGLFIAALLGLGVLEIYIWVKYGNMPISEIPAWVLFFMFGGGGK